MTFAKWLDTFIEEKGIDLEHVIEAEGPEWGLNYIPVQCLVDLMKQAPKHEQAAIKATIIKIDFKNGNVLDYFQHLAKAVAR